MFSVQIAESALVFSGFFIISIASLFYLNLLENIKMVEEHIDKITNFILKTYVVLLFIFLTYYSFIGASIYAGTNLNNANVIGILLFGGSLFVIIGTIVMTRLVHCIHENNMQLIRSLINAVDARDKNLIGHSMHVRAIAILIYENLPKRMSKTINRHKFEYACLMHDQGKIGIPESILNNPFALTNDEWSKVKEHPKIGAQIIENIIGFADVAEWILYHHERMDGKGYYGLDGNEIPLASRIICLADAYSAIVMHRSYKNAKGHNEAIKILKENSGTQFDPELIKITAKISINEINEKLELLKGKRY